MNNMIIFVLTIFSMSFIALIIAYIITNKEIENYKQSKKIELHIEKSKFNKYNSSDTVKCDAKGPCEKRGEKICAFCRHNHLYNKKSVHKKNYFEFR